MASDLLGIGTSGVMAQQRLLQTTSNNIVNVNSQGYVRERTLIYTNSVGLGTGDMLTERVINAYAQGEVRRDTSAYFASATRYEQFSNTDTLLGEPATASVPPSLPISRRFTPPTKRRPTLPAARPP